MEITKEVFLNAIHENNISIVEEGIRKGFDVNEYHLIVGAASRGDAKTVEFLIKLGADVNIGNGNPLYSASTVEVVELLVKAGADIEIRNREAICQPCILGYTEIVNFLIKAGANIHVHDDFPIWAASKHGHTEIVKLLIEAGANVNTRFHKTNRYWDDNETPIDFATNQKNTEMVKILLEAGAIPTEHAIKLATQDGNSEILNLLLKFKK